MIINGVEVDVLKYEIVDVNGEKFWKRIYRKRSYLFNENSKRCCRCLEIKEFSEFNQKIGCFLMLRKRCKKCRAKEKKDYYKRNRDKVNALKKEYRKNNKEKVRKYAKKYRGFLAKCKTYEDLLTIDEKPKCNEKGFLITSCTYCGIRFSPTNAQVSSRVIAINNLNYGECRLYCSEGCKTECPTYGSLGVNPNNTKLARESNPVLRQQVLLRDNYTCQKCHATKNLHCHHIVPVKIDPGMSEDTDNCIALCRTCHYETHGLIDGCGLGELRMAEDKCLKSS